MLRRKHRVVDIFELRPRQLYPSELAEKGKVVVIVPEHQNKFTELFFPKKKKIMRRVKLDILGSAVWDSCDGTMTVQDIAEKMKQEYGDLFEPVDTRVRSYIEKLHINKFIDIDLTKEEKPQFYQKIK